MVGAAGFLGGSGNQFAKSGWDGDEIGGDERLLGTLAGGVAWLSAAGQKHPIASKKMRLARERRRRAASQEFV